MTFGCYAWYVRGAKHAAMCRTSVESVKKADPLAKCIVVTDERDPPWDIPGVQLQYIDEGMPIMIANIEAQISALSAAWTDGYERITFLDTDTLMLKPIPAFGDIAFTWRDHVLQDDEGGKIEGIASRMPYNYGVIVAVPKLAVFEAILWVRERIRVMTKGYRDWYGNQVAIVQLAGPRPQSGCAIDERRIPWKLTSFGKPLQVGKIPCETYNFTPQTAIEDVSGKYVLHFKQSKRHLMEAYAKRLGLNWYLNEREAA